MYPPKSVSISIVIANAMLFKQALPGGAIEGNGSKQDSRNPFLRLLLCPEAATSHQPPEPIPNIARELVGVHPVEGQSGALHPTSWRISFSECAREIKEPIGALFFVARLGWSNMYSSLHAVAAQYF